MLSLQEMSDRFEIQDLLTAYCTAVDAQRWDDLDALFTADAVIDYTAVGGPVGNLEETKEFLGNALILFPAYQHLIANIAVSISGDTATARTMCHNPMVLPDGNKVLVVGIWYDDSLVRVDGNWRIARRVEEKSYMHAFAGANFDAEPAPAG
jgi:hypothetical protein